MHINWENRVLILYWLFWINENISEVEIESLYWPIINLINISIEVTFNYQTLKEK